AAGGRRGPPRAVGTTTAGARAPDPSGGAGTGRDLARAGAPGGRPPGACARAGGVARRHLAPGTGARRVDAGVLPRAGRGRAAAAGRAVARARRLPGAARRAGGGAPARRSLDPGGPRAARAAASLVGVAMTRRTLTVHRLGRVEYED